MFKWTPFGWTLTTQCRVAATDCGGQPHGNDGAAELDHVARRLHRAPASAAAANICPPWMDRIRRLDGPHPFRWTPFVYMDPVQMDSNHDMAQQIAADNPAAMMAPRNAFFSHAPTVRVADDCFMQVHDCFVSLFCITPRSCGPTGYEPYAGPLVRSLFFFLFFFITLKPSVE